MNRLRKSWIVVIAAAVFAFTFVGAAQADIMTHYFTSSAKGGVQDSVKVYVPPSYGTGSDYPMVVILHGAGMTPSSLIDQQFDSGFGTYNFAGVMDLLINFGYIDPMIVVIPDGSTPDYWAGSFWEDSELYGNYDSFVLECITQVDNNYDTYGISEQRAIMGYSMGGHGALKLGFRYPNMFAAIVSHSGPADVDALVSETENFLIDSLLTEYPGGAPYTFDPAAGTYSGLSFSMAGAFSPDTQNLDAADKADRVQFIANSDGSVNQTVKDLWHPDFPSALARDALAHLQQIPLYIDCGMGDELGVYATNTAIIDTLAALGLTASTGNSPAAGEYWWGPYYGGHTTHVDSVLQKSLPFVSDVFASNPTVSVERDAASGLPARIALHPAWPNPFNAGTTVAFELPSRGQVSLKVFDITGRQVATLVDEARSAGLHRVSWQPANLSSGIYMLRLRSGMDTAVRRVTLVK